MKSRTVRKLYWSSAFGALAAFVSLSAEAAPSYTIKECAQADLFHSTGDKKKEKVWRKRCNEAIKHGGHGTPKPPHGRPPKPPVNHDPAPHPGPTGPATPWVKPGPAPVNNPPPTKTKVINLLDVLGLGKKPPAPAAVPPPKPRKPAPAAPTPVVPVVYKKAPQIPAAAPAPAPVDPQAQARERKAKHDRQVRDTTIASLASDKQAIGQEHSSVFGLALGEPLVLPVCDAQGSKSDVTCLEQDQTETRALALRMAGANQAKFSDDFDFDLARLGSDQCPNWIGKECNVSVVTKSGFVVGVAFFTSGKPEKDVAKNIEEKYGQKPSTESAAVCPIDSGSHKKSKAPKASERGWELPHLTVHYAPLAGRTCDEGRVVVDTATLTQSLQRSEPATPDSSEPKPEPKM